MTDIQQARQIKAVIEFVNRAIDDVRVEIESIANQQRVVEVVEPIVGPPGAPGPRGLQGPKGVSVSDSKIVGGDLYITLDNGQMFNAGQVVGRDGVDGKDGADGRPGEIGPMGPVGPQGPQGVHGPAGPMGDRGPQGERGDRGLQGERGPVGPQGASGKDGLSIVTARVVDGELVLRFSDETTLTAGLVVGPQGERGQQGDRGEMGPKGDKGDRGEVGPAGERGQQGQRGIKGDRGEKGDPGPQGAPGRDADLNKLTAIENRIEEVHTKLSGRITSIAASGSGGGSYSIMDQSDVEYKSRSNLVTGDVLIFDQSINKFRSQQITELGSVTFNGSVTANSVFAQSANLGGVTLSDGMVDGRDVSVDGSFLDHLIEPLYGVFDTAEELMVVNNTDPTKFDLIPFTYYINGVRYHCNGQTGISPGVLPGQFVIVGINSDGLHFAPANQFFQPLDLVDKLELGGVVVGAGGAISIIGNSHFDADEFMRNQALRTKFVEGTSFIGTAGQIMLNAVNPLQMDIMGGTIVDADSNFKTIVAATNIGAVGIWRTNGSYQIGPVGAPYVINTTQYDGSTGLIAIPNNKFVTHTVARSSRTGTVYFVFGVTVYASLGEAVDAPPFLGVFEGSVGSQIEPLATIVVKGGGGIQTVVDVRNSTRASVSATTSTLQTTYDRSTTPEIITDATRGALSVKGGTGNDSDKNLSVENNAGSETFFVRANGSLFSAGSVSSGIATITSTTTLNSTHSTVLVNAATGPVTINLPTAATTTGRQYVIKKIDASANAVTIDPSGTETVDGAATRSISTQYQVVTVQSNGSAWWVL